MKLSNEGPFRDRKLNSCEVCGTHKMLGVRTRDNGKLYFLCQGHAKLDDALHEEVKKIG